MGNVRWLEPPPPALPYNPLPHVPPVESAPTSVVLADNTALIIPGMSMGTRMQYSGTVSTYDTLMQYPRAQQDRMKGGGLGDPAQAILGVGHERGDVMKIRWLGKSANLTTGVGAAVQGRLGFTVPTPTAGNNPPAVVRLGNFTSFNPCKYRLEYGDTIQGLAARYLGTYDWSAGVHQFNLVNIGIYTSPDKVAAGLIINFPDAACVEVNRLVQLAKDECASKNWVWDGNNFTCGAPATVPQYTTCSDGARVAIGTKCPEVNNTSTTKVCADGTVVPVDAICPAPVSQCPKGQKWDTKTNKCVQIVSTGGSGDDSGLLILGLAAVAALGLAFAGRDDKDKKGAASTSAGVKRNPYSRSRGYHSARYGR